jgi:hypothetical protein
MFYFVLYFIYALWQGVSATRAVLREEKYMVDKDVIVLLTILFTALAPIVTAVMAYGAMKSVIIFLVTGDK